MTDTAATNLPRNSIAILRQFARPRPPQERCDLCAAALGEEHEHLLEPASRQLSCACGACAVLFSGAENQRYRRVPRRVEYWPDFSISDLQWESLGVPIALAFFFQSTPQERIVTMYPSPGGATEATLAGEVWDILCKDNPRLSQLAPDVEALMVNRMRGAREYYRVPIDHCFKLVGLIRTHWRGLSGGMQVWKEIDLFFKDLQARAAGGRVHA